MVQTPRTEFAQALRAIATERGLDAVVILGTIKEAIAAAFRRDAKERDEEFDWEKYDLDVELDEVTGGAKVFLFSLEDPKDRKDVTPPGFGRIAAQTAKQVIRQKIREAEKGVIMEEFNQRVGTLISGMVLRFDGPDVRVDIGRAIEAIMPAEERIPSERLSPNQRLTFLLKAIDEEAGRGRQIILSRADPDFVTKLFSREVPEIGSGSVEVRGVAREAGVRTKIAVFSSQSGVDPVGSCVGQKGVRVQAVTNELGGERVDIIFWSEDLSEYVKAALSPAEIVKVKVDEKKKQVKVTVPEDQLSLTIGKDGQNVRLASQLIGWTIEIESLTGEKKTKKEEKKKEEKKKEGKEEGKKSRKKIEKEKTEMKEVQNQEEQSVKEEKIEEQEVPEEPEKQDQPEQ